MEKQSKAPSKVTQEEALESLETAIEEIETLSRAFEIVSEACAETEEESISFEGCSNRFFFN